MIPIITFSCSRPIEFKNSIESYNNLHGIDIQTSILHEDYFEDGIQDVLKNADFKFGNYIECRPALGMGHAIYEIYKKKESKWVLHMEDDWIINHPIDVEAVVEHAEKFNLNQVFLSSKRVLKQALCQSDKPQADREPDVLIGSTGLFVQKYNKENFGHMIPNSTPSIIKTDLFHGFVDVMNEYINNGISTNKKFSEDFKPDNHFLFVSTPLRFFKVWATSLIGKPPSLGFLIGSNITTISHQDRKIRRRLTRKKKK